MELNRFTNKPAWNAGVLLCLLGLVGIAPQCVLADPFPSEIELVIKSGDTLIGIAHRLLADPNAWPQLQTLNHVKDPYHLKPGSTLRIPTSMMASEGQLAHVVTSSGPVMVDGHPSTDGAALAEGAHLTTGGEGFLTLRLADGTILRMANNSIVELERQRRLTKAERLETVIQVEEGRVDMSVAPQGENRFVVKSRVAAASVRGTAFGLATTSDHGAATDVTEGKVKVDGSASDATAQFVAAGHGEHVNADGKTEAPVILLAAANLSAISTRQEQTTLRFSYPAVPGAASYRATISRDADFSHTLAEVSSKLPEAKFTGIADGHYFLRVRALDANEIAGIPAVNAFVLKARPEPPILIEPAPAAKVRAEAVTLHWTESPQATGYRVVLQSETTPPTVVADKTTGTEASIEIPAVPVGDFVWRVATIVPGTSGPDQGPLSAPQHFKRLSAQAPPADPSPENGRLRLSWTGEAGQTFHVQVASDDKFKTPIVDSTTKDTSLLLGTLANGIYFVRVQATDPDGFVGEFSSARRFPVESSVVDSGGGSVSTTTGKLRGNN